MNSPPQARIFKQLFTSKYNQKQTLGGKSRVFSPLMGGKKSAAGGKF